jgi:hypothetical protein
LSYAGLDAKIAVAKFPIVATPSTGLTSFKAGMMSLEIL